MPCWIHWVGGIPEVTAVGLSCHCGPRYQADSRLPQVACIHGHLHKLASFALLLELLSEFLCLLRLRRSLLLAFPYFL